MTVCPAHRLEELGPALLLTVRIRLGANAYLTLFVPDRIIDLSSFDRPSQFASGVKYVLVGGVAVVEGGVPRRDLHPGRPIRAAITN